MEAALQRLDGDSELRGRLGRGQSLDVTEQDHLAIDRVEVAEHGREQRGATPLRELVVRGLPVASELVLDAGERDGRVVVSIEEPEARRTIVNIQLAIDEAEPRNVLRARVAAQSVSCAASSASSVVRQT